MSDTTERLSFREKAGYGLGDAAANFIFQTMLIFQLSFYTDTFGITAAAAGTLFLVVRVWDAIFDPLVGLLADRTETRWGKFRPWVLWTAAPFALMGVLAFTTPGFGATGKLVYAYVTYTLLMMVYSANNLPYSALSGVITGDLAERTSLSSFRFIFAMLAAFVVQGSFLPLVKYFGAGDRPRGHQMTMGLFSVLCFLFFIVTFLTTRERIRPDPNQRSTVRQDLTDLVRNRPWAVLFATTVLVFITLSMRGGVMVYYFEYYIGNKDLFSLFNVCGLGATIAGILFSKSLAMRYGKRNVYMWGLFLTTVCTAAFVFLPANAIRLTFALEMLRQFVYGPTIPLLWAMMADVADYSEWKTGRRATAIVFAAIVFGLKAGLGFGGALGGWLLSLYGYVPNAAQSVRALAGIRLTASVYAAIPFLLGVLSLFLYEIDKTLNIRIAEELAERRKKFAPGPAASR